MAIAAGAFDDPSLLPPTVQFGIECKIDFVDRLHALPGHRTEEDADEAPFVLEIVSYQHPDHDTGGAWRRRTGNDARTPIRRCRNGCSTA